MLEVRRHTCAARNFVCTVLLCQMEDLLDMDEITEEMKQKPKGNIKFGSTEDAATE